MRSMTIVSILLSWMALASAAEAEQAFVIKSHEADPKVGTPVDASTALRISADGYLVFLTSAGQVLRRNGPFSGSASTILDAAASTGGGNTSAKVISAIVDLASQKSSSSSRLLAIRGSQAQPEITDIFAITASTRTYCATADRRPMIVLQDSPGRDGRLSVTRLSAPKQKLEADWPAENRGLLWPEDWPPLRKGLYTWMVAGKQSSFEVVRSSDNLADLDLPDLAYELERHGCADQASRALSNLIREARIVQ